MSNEGTVSIANLVSSGALTVGDGYRTKKAELADIGFRIVRVADVVNGVVDLTGSDFVSEERREAIGQKRAMSGDVILTTKGTVGRVAIVPELEELVVYSPQVCFFRVEDHGVVIPSFLAYWFVSSEFLQQASHRMNNTDMAAYINLADIGSLEISMPSIAVQREIVDVLGALDAKISGNLSLISTMEQLLAGEVEFRWLRDDAAPTLEIGELFEINPNLTKPPEGRPVYLSMKNLPQTGNGIHDWEHRPARGGARFSNGDTLLARITPCLQNRKTGYVDFLESGETGIGSTEFVVMRSRRGIPSALSYFVAVNEQFRAFAIRRMVGTSGRQRVSASDISSYTLPVPNQGWLRNFGERAEEQFELMKSLRGENRILTELRDTLLPELMSGRLRVKDAEKKIEEVV